MLFEPPIKIPEGFQMSIALYACQDPLANKEPMIVLAGPSGFDFAGDMVRMNPFVTLNIPSNFYEIIFR